VKVRFCRTYGRGIFQGGNMSELWAQVYDFENLYQAAHVATENKKYKPASLRFFQNPEENLTELQNELIWKTYKPGDYNNFKVRDPKPVIYRRSRSATASRKSRYAISLSRFLTPASFTIEFVGMKKSNPKEALDLDRGEVESY
jgi:hypothetical protein